MYERIIPNFSAQRPRVFFARLRVAVGVQYGGVSTNFLRPDLSHASWKTLDHSRRKLDEDAMRNRESATAT